MTLRAVFRMGFSLLFAVATLATESEVDRLMKLVVGEYSGKTQITLLGLKIIPDMFSPDTAVNIQNTGDGLKFFYRSKKGETQWSLSGEELKFCLADELNQDAKNALSPSPNLNGPAGDSERKTWHLVLEARKKRGTLTFVSDKLTTIEIAHGDFSGGKLPSDGFAIKCLEKNPQE